MGDLLTDLNDLLSSGGITTTVYRGHLPPLPDDAIQLVQTGGYPPDRAMPGSAGRGGLGAGLIVRERPTVQVIRRSVSPERARVEMSVIVRLLDGVGDRVVNGTRIGLISALQDPFQLPDDETSRSLLACNFLVEREPSTATST